MNFLFSVDIKIYWPTCHLDWIFYSFKSCTDRLENISSQLEQVSQMLTCFIIQYKQFTFISIITNLIKDFKHVRPCGGVGWPVAEDPTLRKFPVWFNGALLVWS